MRTEADFLQDMLDAANRVIGYVSGRTREEFDENMMLEDAVLYRLAVIGEAATHVSTAIRENAPELPWKKIVRMRNVLVHGYFGVDPDITWDTATTHVHELIAVVTRLRATLPDHSGQDGRQNP